MQGYILNYNQVKDEDLIVTILTEHNIKVLYRFYGARHSIINIGYKVDFEEEVGVKVTINRLKDLLHLSFDWILDSNKLYHWQLFIKLLYKHLKDIESLDKFYINLLDTVAKKLSYQSPKRSIIEGYLSLLEYEGRLHTKLECLLCNNFITDNSVIILRSFAQAHKECIYKSEFNSKIIIELFNTKNSFNLDQNEINKLWLILLEGL